MLVWIFWIVDRQVFFGEPLGDLVVVVVVFGTHLLTGLMANYRFRSFANTSSEARSANNVTASRSKKRRNW